MKRKSMKMIKTRNKKHCFGVNEKDKENQEEKSKKKRRRNEK